MNDEGLIIIYCHLVLLKSMIGIVMILAMKARHITHDKVVTLFSSLTGCGNV